MVFIYSHISICTITLLLFLFSFLLFFFFSFFFISVSTLPDRSRMVSDCFSPNKEPFMTSFGDIDGSSFLVYRQNVKFK